MSSTKKWLHMIAFALVVLGAIDLGLYGIVPANAAGDGFDLVQKIFGFHPDVLNIVYILIGASGVYLAVTHIKECRVCEAKKSAKEA